MKKLIVYFFLSSGLYLQGSDIPVEKKQAEIYKEIAQKHSLPAVERTCEAIAQEEDNDMAKIYFAFLVIGGMGHLEKELERQRITEKTRGW
jgi:hypothetical protein